jgi:hypothetical protein
MMILAQRKYLNHNHFDLQDKTLSQILVQIPQKFFVDLKSGPFETGQTGLVATALSH